MTHKLETLDGARGVAAIAVLLYHLGQWTENTWLMSHGYLAVDFFFCMSGFIVAYAYGARLDAGMPFLKFVKVRTIRLYPVIFLGTLLGAVFYLGMAKLGHQPFTTQDVLSALRGVFLIPFLFIASPLGPGIYPLNSPFWSIFYEVVANFAWAAFLRKIPAIPLFACAAIIAIFAYSNERPLSLGGDFDGFYWGLLRVFLGFTAGLAVHRLLEIRRPTIRISPWLILAALALIMAAPHSWSYVYDLFCAIVLFPVLTALAVCVHQGPVERPAMKWLGDVSYPLYGIHRPLCQATVVVMSKIAHDPLLFSGLTIAVGALFSLLAATLVFHFFDVPVRNYLSGRRRAIVEQTAP